MKHTQLTTSLIALALVTVTTTISLTPKDVEAGGRWKQEPGQIVGTGGECYNIYTCKFSLFVTQCDPSGDEYTLVEAECI